jgi:hypothetical protein
MKPSLLKTRCLHFSTCIRCLFALVFWLAFSVSRGAAASDTHGHDAKKPVVIAFSGVAPAHGRLESDFITALRLSLDRFDVIRVDVSGRQFASLPLASQLSVIASHTRRHHAVASTWVEQADENRILLHLVALSTGRALVRIIETRQSPSASEELAFAAQELLGEAYLFDGARNTPAIAETVDELKSSLPPAPHNGFSRLALLPYFEIADGLTGHTGPSFRLGGGADIWVPLGNIGFVRLGLGGTSGPNTSFAGGMISSRGGFARALLGVRIQWGKLVFCPDIGGVSTLHRLELVVGNSANESYTAVDFRAQLGLNLAVPLASRLHLVLGGALGAYVIRQRFSRLSDGRSIFTTPWLEWSAAAGVRMSF